MSFVMTYDEKNRERIKQLAPHTETAALKWYQYCVDHSINLLITETKRTLAQQKEYVRQGKSQTLHSYHLVGQALDFVPIVKGKADYTAYNKKPFTDAIAQAKKLGFEWGGEWRTFVDKPHLQYKYKGYGTDK